MNKFKTWYVTHQDAITWCLIGVLITSSISSLLLGDYMWAAINFALACINYTFRRIRLT